MVSGSLGEKNGVTSVILLPRKTVISLAAMSSLQGTIPCFITLDSSAKINLYWL